MRHDAHYGVTVKHRSRVAKDPTQPNLRQVHLLHEELFSEVRDAGLHVLPGQMGENVTTRGLDLLSLSTGTRLRLGTHAGVELTGLRNPCAQIEELSPRTSCRGVGPRGRRIAHPEGRRDGHRARWGWFTPVTRSPSCINLRNTDRFSRSKVRRRIDRRERTFSNKGSIGAMTSCAPNTP